MNRYKNYHNLKLHNIILECESLIQFVNTTKK